MSSKILVLSLAALLVGAPGCGEDEPGEGAGSAEEPLATGPAGSVPTAGKAAAPAAESPEAPAAAAPTPDPRARRRPRGG